MRRKLRPYPLRSYREGVFEPVENPCRGEAETADMTMRACPFVRREFHQGLRTRQMVVKELRLTLEKQVFRGVPEESGTADGLSDAVAEIVVQQRGEIGAGRLDGHRIHAMSARPPRCGICRHHRPQHGVQIGIGLGAQAALGIPRTTIYSRVILRRRPPTRFQHHSTHVLVRDGMARTVPKLVTGSARSLLEGIADVPIVYGEPQGWPRTPRSVQLVHWVPGRQRRQAAIFAPVSARP